MKMKNRVYLLFYHNMRSGVEEYIGAFSSEEKRNKYCRALEQDPDDIIGELVTTHKGYWVYINDEIQ